MSASWAPEVQTFWPLTTKWSPSRTARVRSASQVRAGIGLAHPEGGGDLARRIGTAQRCFCSSVPKASSDGAMMRDPAG